LEISEIYPKIMDDIVYAPVSKDLSYNLNRKIEAAYTKGATTGALEDRAHKKIIRHISFFLTIKEGTCLAQTHRKAYEAANCKIATFLCKL